jgi:hypothetical protein
MPTMLLASVLCSVATAAEKPNTVFIMVDDI